MSEETKRLLSTLMVLGAQSAEKAISVDELAARLGVGVSEIQAELSWLTKAGYALKISREGKVAVYLTGTGVITASSAYS